MKTKGKKEYAVTVIQGVLAYPSIIVPQLDRQEILVFTSDALLLFQEKEISLGNLIDFAECLLTFMKVQEEKLENLLEEIWLLPE